MEEAPEYLCCPITLELMNDPVICTDGYSYERKTIMQYLEKNSISPMTKQPIDKKNIFPNRTLKDAIENYKINIEKNINSNKEPKVSHKSDDNTHTNKNYEMDSDIDEESKKIIKEMMKSDKINNSKTKKKTQNMLMEIEEILKNIVDKNNYKYHNKYVGLDDDKISLFYVPLIEQNITQLEWLVKNDNTIHKSFYLCAIINKLPKVIRWLLEQKCAIGEDSINYAVSLGDKNLVYWLLTNNCNWNIYTFSHAIESKNLEYLSWLIEMDCFWGILMDKHLKIIQQDKKIKDWLMLKKCPWSI